MRRRGRLRKILIWSFLLVAAVATGSVIFAYLYITDSDTLAAMVRAEAPRYLPGSEVRVNRVQLRPLVGDVNLTHTTVSQTLDGRKFEALTIPWIQVRSDFRSILWGKVNTREVFVAKPLLRIKRRNDGSWNLQGLLADPWPKTKLPRPMVTISRGSVELVEGRESSPILHDVSLRIEPVADGSYQFEGTARGDMFDRIDLEGTFHPQTGKIVFRKGDLTALAINDSLKNRLPAEWRDSLQKIGLERGEASLSIVRLERGSKASPKWNFELDVTLREGAWKCQKLPFPLADVSLSATITNSAVVVHSAEGRDGKTKLTVRESRLSTADLIDGPMEVNLEVEKLDLDDRLKAKTPEKLIDLWRDYLPSGQVNATVKAVRVTSGGKIRYGMAVKLLDVAVKYRHFAYPLEHIEGYVVWAGSTITVDVRSIVGRKPVTAKGTIENPGPAAEVELTFQAGDLPIDETLLKALPPEAERAVRDFNPEGTVRGKALLRRTPSDKGVPTGKVRVDAELDLNPGFAARWKGLPYQVRDLSGHLTLAPKEWTFTGMKGKNGLAMLEATGKVKEVSKGVLDVDVTLKAEHLPFDGQLREALPPEWRKTWSVLNPTGTTGVDARIVLKPGKPPDYKFWIRPETDTRVVLTLTPVPGTEFLGHGGPIQLPAMENVTGKFFFDNGTVSMNDVRFLFRQAPVEFEAGTVILQNTGRFQLHVDHLWVKRLRLESELRKIMPPVMAQFVRRLDDGKTFEAKGNLDIAWSGQADAPAVCSWDSATVIFNDNTIAAGIPLEHIQGEINNIKGRADGRTIEVDGLIYISSVSLSGQHFTDVESPLKIANGKAELTNLKAQFLKGTLYGKGSVTLDVTPRYQASLKLVGAQLEEYARSVPGHQEVRGEVSGAIEFTGLGQDVKSLQGKGDAHVSRGDLGKLPIVYQIKEILNLKARAVFDAADVDFTIGNGRAVFDPIKITSNLYNLQGSGTLNPMGYMDLWLRFVPLRDEKLHFRVLPEIAAELLAFHVQGRAGAVQVLPQPFPFLTRKAGAVVKKIGEREARR